MAQQGTDPPEDVVACIVYPPENVVACIVLLSGIRTRTLFDTGVSHSFILRTFDRTHGFGRDPLLEYCQF